MSFNLVVNALGGKTESFPTTIQLNGCPTQEVSVTNTGEWDTSLVNSIPTRANTEIAIPEFTFSNEYCGLDSFTVTGADADLVSISGSVLTYPTDLVEPKTLSFNLVVNAAGGQTQSYPTTIKLDGCSSEIPLWEHLDG